MPEAEHEARGELGLPVRLPRDDLVDERKEPSWVAEHLNVDIELDVTVLGLRARVRVSAEPR